MSVLQQNVMIKGTKDGLLFLLNDSCSFEQLIEELEEKMSDSHQQILKGPIMRVSVQTGKRTLSEEEKMTIVGLIRSHGNLVFKNFITETEKKDKEKLSSSIQTYRGIVRSGQVLRFEGNVMLLGEVNPGASILATGDIYILGSLKGMAHAGVEGNKEAIIAASLLLPTQIRIANVISHPPEQWQQEQAMMKFAYLNDEEIAIESITKLPRISPLNGEKGGS